MDVQVGEGGVLRLEPGKPGVGGRPLHYTPLDSWQASRSLPRGVGVDIGVLCIPDMMDITLPRAEDERLGWSKRPTSAPSQGRPNWIDRDKQV